MQVGVSYGLGLHMNDIPDPESQIQAYKYTVIAPNFSVVSTTTGKISVAIFLLRLMGPTASAWRRWFLYILTVISIGMNVLAIIVIMGFCRPPEKIWRPETPGSCFSLQLQLVCGTAQAGEYEVRFSIKGRCVDKHQLSTRRLIWHSQSSRHSSSGECSSLYASNWQSLR